MKQIIIILAIVAAIVGLSFEATIMKSHSKEAHKNETFQETADLKRFYSDSQNYVGKMTPLKEGVPCDQIGIAYFDGKYVLAISNDQYSCDKDSRVLIRFANQDKVTLPFVVTYLHNINEKYELFSLDDDLLKRIVKDRDYIIKVRVVFETQYKDFIIPESYQKKLSDGLNWSYFDANSHTAKRVISDNDF